MNTIKWVDLLASVCLLAGSIIKIVEGFVDVHFVLSIAAIVLILTALFLWLVVLKRMKKK